MVRCNFCWNKIDPGTGKLFVQLDGKLLYFCSNKCEKNMFKLRRKPHKTKWSNLYEGRKKKGD